ncbi:TnpV protein [uncultured Thomasclavelia sp.]
MQRHLRYIKEHNSVFYANLLIKYKLNSYLKDIYEQVSEIPN